LRSDKFILSLLALLLFSLQASAAEPPTAVIASLEKPFNLSPYLEFIEDPAHELSWQDISAGRHDHLWQANRGTTFKASNRQSRYCFGSPWSCRQRWYQQHRWCLLTHSRILLAC